MRILLVHPATFLFLVPEADHCAVDEEFSGATPRQYLMCGFSIQSFCTYFHKISTELDDKLGNNLTEGVLDYRVYIVKAD